MDKRTWINARVETHVKTHLLVVEEFDGSEVISDPLSEDAVFTASLSGLVSHGLVDRGIEPEK